MMAKTKRFSGTAVIIPTLNEERNIGILIDRISEVCGDISIIIADDGSKDNTLRVAKEHGGLVIDRSKRDTKGITASVVEALDYVNEENFIVIDADLQHPPEKIPEIIEQLRANDVVIAVRARIIGGWGFIRKLESWVAALLARIRLMHNIKDPMSGFFGAKTALVRNMNKSNFELRCFKILFNILKNVNFKTTKVGYIYYDFMMRKEGESKISKKHVWYFLHSLVK